MAVSFKGAHFPKDIILMGVRWYVAYPLSTRHVEELMEERGVSVDHSTITRWVVKYSPQLEEAFHRRKRPVWVRLAPGRDIHSCQRPVAVSVSCGRHIRPDHRFFAHRAPGYRGGASVFEESHPPQWPPRDDHH
jgi:hypothetical protein